MKLIRGLCPGTLHSHDSPVSCLLSVRGSVGGWTCGRRQFEVPSFDTTDSYILGGPQPHPLWLALVLSWETYWREEIVEQSHSLTERPWPFSGWWVDVSLTQPPHCFKSNLHELLEIADDVIVERRSLAVIPGLLFSGGNGQVQWTPQLPCTETSHDLLWPLPGTDDWPSGSSPLAVFAA